MKLASIGLLLLTCSGLSFGQSFPQVHLNPIYANLTFENPVSLQIPNDGTQRRFLIEQTGKILILPSNESSGEAKIFHDFRDRMSVAQRFEEGLLGLAFHPEYKENGKFYVYYNKQGPKRTVLSEMKVSSGDPDRIDPESERILMEIQQPDWNHNSGNLWFGPQDGYLYIAVGDGGRRHGVFLLAQNKTQWNGKVLRIDVNATSKERPYGVPADNPFIDEKAACPEIWALGLRNPWGGAFDKETGLFYLADVGQSAHEEINLIVRGGNYGWEFREGATEFGPRQSLMDFLGEKNVPPKGSEFIEPIHTYDHLKKPGRSITGGFVYQGKSMPELKGHFIYGDWRHGDMWALHYDEKTKETVNHLIYDPATPDVQPAGFYPDEEGEVMVLDWKGRLFRMAKAP